MGCVYVWPSSPNEKKYKIGEKDIERTSLQLIGWYCVYYLLHALMVLIVTCAMFLALNYITFSPTILILK